MKYIYKLNNLDCPRCANKIECKLNEHNDINSASINGYTYYYIQADDKKYKLSITLSDNLPFVKIGDKLKVAYLKDKDIIEIEKVY